MQGNPGYLATCWDFHHAITAFSAGGLSHVFCDALTIQGVTLGLVVSGVGRACCLCPTLPFLEMSGNEKMLPDLPNLSSIGNKILLTDVTHDHLHKKHKSFQKDTKL